MSGNASEIQIAAFLIALRCKGETVEELAGLARTMRARAARVTVERSDMLDTAGTGGGRRTFNVSTTAALIAAGAGCTVAKHGNRSATGLSGSADVLEALGARIDLTPEAVGRCIDEVGFGFMFAPAHHQATRFVGCRSAASSPGSATIFNFLRAAEANPAGATRQLIGVSDPHYLETMAGALALLDTEHAMLVSGDDGVDELSISAPTIVVEDKRGEELASVHGRARGGRACERHAPAGDVPGGDAAAERRHRPADLRRRAQRAARPGRAQRGRGDLRRRRRRVARAGRPRGRGGDRLAARPQPRSEGSWLARSELGTGDGMNALELDPRASTRVEVARRRASRRPLAEALEDAAGAQHAGRPAAAVRGGAAGAPGLKVIRRAQAPFAVGRHDPGGPVALEDVVTAYERGGGGGAVGADGGGRASAARSTICAQRVAVSTLPILRKDFVGRLATSSTSRLAAGAPMRSC